MFGGAGYDGAGTSNFLNDLWKYSPSSGLWTWVNGSSTTAASGVYGTKGTAASTNVPGARYGGASWIDASGNLWLFGGGYGSSTATVNTLYNDLWKYTPSTGLWTWVSGSSSANVAGVYGTKGTAASTSYPGARFEASGWIDASGNFWIFSGSGYDGSGNLLLMNDLWKYTPSTGLWTWMSGSSTGSASGVYGTKGTAASTNVPGARYASTSATDASGNLWLFGGAYGATTATLTSYYNDLWMYSPSTGLWTWMSGSSTANVYGVYGTKGTASTSNYPGSRIGMMGWTNATGGNIWLLGGVGYSGSSSGYLDDFWEYNISAGTWTWVGGDNGISVNGVYGTKGLPAAANKPGSRYSAPVTWTDAGGDLWLFGGKGYAASSVGSTVGYLNDLWVYEPVVVLTVSWQGFTAVGSGGEALLNWQTAEEQNSLYFNVQRSRDGMNWQTIGMVDAAGSSTGLRNYQFTDANPYEGMNYYRLQLVNTGGGKQYSIVAGVEFSKTRKLIWTAAGAGAVGVYLQSGSNEWYRLVDVNGRIRARGYLQDGMVLLRDLQPGVYVMQVMSGAGGMVSEKIMVSR
jgi:N-acetylneuraminic acid mutarotase